MSADYNLFRKAFGKPEFSVWPGHPITIAWVIVQVFPTYEAAFEKKEAGWGGTSNAAALGSMEIPGAGGTVCEALALLKALRQKKVTEEAAFDRANEVWERCDDLKTRKPDVWKEGQEQADRVKPLLLARRDWWKA